MSSPSPLTAIHRALGTGASEFTVDLVDRAIAASIAEAADLDWKAKLPDFSSDEARLELAKDVAAMANTRGGLIVFGVAERASKATKRANVDVSESSQDRLRQSLYLFIRPFVNDVRVLAAEDPELPGTGVLALSIERSPDAPHQVGRDGLDRVRFPYRDGATTKFLREHELARAYADRFQGNRETRKRTIDTFERARSGHPDDGGDWLLGIALPLRVPRSSSPRLSKADIERVVSSSQLLALDVLPEADDRHEVLGELAFVSGAEYHRRLHRSVASGTGHRYGLALHFELADDGPLIVGSGFPRPALGSSPVLTVERLESFTVDLLAAASATADELSIYGTWIVGLDLDHASQLFSLGRLDRYAGGRLVGTGRVEALPDARPLLQNFERVEAEVVFPCAPEDIIDVARQMTLDVLEEFSSAHLVKLRIRAT